METILEQIEKSSVEEQNVEKVEKEKKKKPVSSPRREEIEEKREQLSILAVLGTIETYAGVKMSLGDVKKLTPKDVERYHNRYQVTMGNQVTGGLVDMALETTAEVLSYALPIDDKEELCNDLKQNELAKQELNNIAGYVILHGGRFVALGSVLLQVVKHIKWTEQPPEQPLEHS